MLGQVNALAQQIQRETDEAQTLSQEEQALTKAWLEACASLNIALNIQEDIAPWMNEQEHYERQLYQLSQRLNLQNQLNEQEAQERQYQQQRTATRRALEHTLLALSLSVPEEGNEADWLHAREAEFAHWQEKQTQHGVLQERMSALKPLLDTLPATHGEEAEPAIPDDWRDIHNECVSLQSQLAALQQQEALERERLQQSQTQFTAALSASCFADRDAFLAALLDDDAIRRLEQLKQSLENQIQQAAAFPARLISSCRRTLRCARKNLTRMRLPCKASCSSWRNGFVRTPRIRARSASSLSRTAITASISRR